MGLFPSANDFRKAGPGVEKDTPRKTGIGRFFERVFNRPDAAELLFGGRLNLGEYNDAYYSFLDFIVAQGEAERRRLDEMMAKYSLSRIKGREKK